MNEVLQQAIALARTGQTSAAASMLRMLVEREPNNSEALLWLGGLTGDPQARHGLLTRVLTLDPENQRAQQGLDALRGQHPNVFDGTRANSYTTRPLEMITPPTALSGSEGDHIDTHAASVGQHRAAIYDAPTQPHQVITTTTTTPLFSTVDQPTASTPIRSSAGFEPIPTPTQPMPTIVEPKPRRNIAAAFARVLLGLLWLVTTGVLVVLTAFAFRYAGVLATNPQAVVPANVSNIADFVEGFVNFGSRASLLQIGGYVLAGFSVLGLLITLGTWLRRRFGLILSLIAGLLLAALAVMLVVLAYMLPTGLDLGLGNVLQVSNEVAAIIVAMLLAWPLLMAFVAWPDFFRRKQTA